MASIDHLLNQSATLTLASGVNDYGRPTTGASSTIACRFQEVDKTKLLPNGEVLNLNGIVFVKASVNVSNGDYLTYGGQNYKIVGINKSVNKSAVNHKQLEVTQWQM